MPIICPQCGFESPDGSRFCEKDGFRLTDEPLPPSAVAVPDAVSAGFAPAPLACRCGAGPDAEADGYCTSCGRKWVKPRSPQPRDHVETSLSAHFGGVTDRGLRHPVNEDDCALFLDAGSGVAVMVVCDGVSSSDDASRASAAAAKTCMQKLSEACLTKTNDEAALTLAIADANGAVCALHPLPTSATADPPSTTLVAAIVRDGVAVIGWVGDSRAYWIDRANSSASRLLTHDHSWMNEVVDAGQMTEEEAGQNRLAHAITRCLGQADDPEGSAPTSFRFAFPPGDGFLLLCSDGLWNYAPSAQEIAALILGQAVGNESAVATARHLVAWANAQGGRDNITVAVLAVNAAVNAPSDV